MGSVLSRIPSSRKGVKSRTFPSCIHHKGKCVCHGLRQTVCLRPTYRYTFISGLGAHNLRFGCGKTLSFVDNLVTLSARVPVLVYERIRTSERSHLFKRYRTELRFAGKMNVQSILLLGLNGYWFLAGTRFGSLISNGLAALMAGAKLENDKYSVKEWLHENDRLIVYVIKKENA